MIRRFRALYLANAVIIFVLLVAPIAQLLIYHTSPDRLLLGYYAVLVMVSVTFGISFFGLNIYGAVKYKARRLRYFSLAILTCAWIIWGAYQIVHGYIHDIAP